MPHIQDITGTDYDTLRALLGAWCAGRGAVRSSPAGKLLYEHLDSIVVCPLAHADYLPPLTRTN